MKIPIYINGVASISRMKSFDSLIEQIELPDFKEYIPAMKLRRMSRIMRISNYAALAALKQAQVEVPEAINVGTAFGCLTDTEKFLSTLIEHNEEFANPSAFINSTHNTLAGSLAILIGAHGQNFTFVHPQNAFEIALLDAMAGIAEGSFSNALVGGVDEKTDILESITSHFFEDKVGEGAAYICISKTKNNQSIARIDGVRNHVSGKSPKEFVRDFLSETNLSEMDIDLMIGSQQVLDGVKFIDTKPITDCYPTATALACSLASQIIQKQKLPHFIHIENTAINKILVYTRYKNGSQSLILLSKV